MNLVRLFAGEDGEAHFEDAALPLTKGRVGEETPLQMPAGAPFVRRVAADHLSGWHTAGRRQYAVVLSGEMEIEVAGGAARRFRPGDWLLIEDTTGKGHVTRAVGGRPFVLLFIPLAQ